MADPTYCVTQIVFNNTKTINAPISEQIMSLTPKKEDAPEVFRPSQAQKEIAAQGIVVLLPFRTVQNDQSDALKVDLRRALTKEQRDRLAKNEVLYIEVKSLSDPLQKKAKEYIRNTIENQSQYWGGTVFDTKQAYTLILRPESGLNIGIKAPATDGKINYF